MFQASSALAKNTCITAAAVVMRGATLATRSAISAAFVARVCAQALDDRLRGNCRDCGPQKGLEGTPSGHSAGEELRNGIESLIVHDDPLLGTSGAIARCSVARAFRKCCVQPLSLCMSVERASGKSQSKSTEGLTALPTAF